MKTFIRSIVCACALAWLSVPATFAEEQGTCVTEDESFITTEPVCDAEGGDWFRDFIPPSG